MAIRLKNKFFERFYPKQEILNKLTYQEQEVIFNIVLTDLILIPILVAFTICLFVFTMMDLFDARVLGTIVSFVAVFFVSSLVFIRKGHSYLGSYFSTLGFITITLAITFLAPTAEMPDGTLERSTFVSYRTGVFCLMAGIVNSFMCIRYLQLIIFHLACILGLLVSSFTVYLDIFQAQPMVMISSIIFNLLAILFANIVLQNSNKFSTRLIKHSEKQQNKAEEQLKIITNALETSRESLNIGEQLSLSTNSAEQGADKINKLYIELLNETETLSLQTNNVKEASEIVNDKAGVMSNFVKKQNDDIEETSAAVSKISENVSNINIIAKKRQTAMENTALSLDRQNDMLATLVNNVERVQESSKTIAQFVETVDSIAGQTRLLAMNASIEASHAGNAGKGFGVIAQEIRKLSEETTKNSNNIAETLKDNAQIVKEAMQSMSDFADVTEVSTEEIKETIGSMKEILKGISEMEKATKDVMHSLENIVANSSETENIISEVVSQISEQDESLVNISNSTGKLQDRVRSIDSQLTSINIAIDEIHQNAIKNKEVSEKITVLFK
ncbi:MAG: methyl-accepting chemotaxis protein [Treponemataceae bacterium]